MASWLASAAQSNDNFANRLTLNGTGTTAVSNNLNATHETGEPGHADNAAGRSLWWTWTAPTSGVVNFSTLPKQQQGDTAAHPGRSHRQHAVLAHGSGQ